MKKRVQAGYSGWRKVTEGICNKRMALKNKGKVYKRVVLGSIPVRTKNFFIFVINIF